MAAVDLIGATELIFEVCAVRTYKDGSIKQRCYE